MRPKSRGWIRLFSTDPFRQPLIEPNIFAEENDLDVLVEGLKFLLRIGRTPAFQRYNSQLFETRYPGCEGLVLYSDAYLRCMAKVYTTIMWHACGTAKMGSPSDPTTVVDPQLRVKGVEGLRVVDLSIMPTLISGNTNAVAVMIAEKTADYMKGRRLVPFLPPMDKNIIRSLPHLPYQHF